MTREVLPSIDPTRSQARIHFAQAAAEPLGAAGEGARIVAEHWKEFGLLKTEGREYIVQDGDVIEFKI